MRQGAGWTSAPAVEYALEIQQLPSVGHAHRRRPISRGLRPLPFTTVCDVTILYALLSATGRVAVLIWRLPVARPRLLTNDAFGGDARSRGHERQSGFRQLVNTALRGRENAERKPPKSLIFT